MYLISDIRNCLVNCIERCERIQLDTVSPGRLKGVETVILAGCVSHVLEAPDSGQQKQHDKADKIQKTEGQQEKFHDFVNVQRC